MLLTRSQTEILNKIKEAGNIPAKQLSQHEQFLAGQLANKGLVEIETKSTFIGIVVNYIYVKG